MEILTITRDRECVSLNCQRHKYAPKLCPQRFILLIYPRAAGLRLRVTCPRGSSWILRPPLRADFGKRCPRRVDTFPELNPYPASPFAIAGSPVRIPWQQERRVVDVEPGQTIPNRKKGATIATN